MKKRIVIIVLCILTLAAAATVGYVLYHRALGVRMENEYPTDSAGYMEADVPHADPKLVGKWHSTEKPGWYKVYYDDYDEEAQMFWGKEWDESEDVQEEDLKYHGNGWFRWEKNKKELREYATMDIVDVPIHNCYKILLSNSDTLVYREKDYKKVVFHFSKVK